MAALALVLAGAGSAGRSEVVYVECTDQIDNADPEDYLIDSQDPGCSYPYDRDDDETNGVPPPPPPPPPAPPPPPPPPPPPEFEWTPASPWDQNLSVGEYDECDDAGGFVPVPMCVLTDASVPRCKRYVFTFQFQGDVFGVGIGPSDDYAGAWKVCYYPYGGGVTRVVYRYGDSVQVHFPWQWDGNSSGYPQHYRDPHHVQIRYRGDIKVCLPFRGCGPQRHVWLNYDFYDTGLYGRIVRTDGDS